VTGEDLSKRALWPYQQRLVKALVGVVAGTEKGAPMLAQQFRLRTFKRAVTTFAQGLLAVFGASGIGLLDAP
jgi:hypothetical protein